MIRRRVLVLPPSLRDPPRLLIDLGKIALDSSRIPGIVLQRRCLQEEEIKCASFVVANQKVPSWQTKQEAGGKAGCLVRERSRWALMQPVSWS